MSECKHRKPNGVCVIDTEVVYRGYCVDGPCSGYEPMTNADRIRSMTDEELADLLTADCKYIPEELCRKHLGNCDACLREWLKQEIVKE